MVARPLAKAQLAAHAPDVSCRKGQSILEFLLLVPVMLGLTLLMFKVSTAIQMSIVNQKYSRAQIFQLAGNSPIYPDTKKRNQNFNPFGSSRMVIGVSEEAIEGDGGQPEASTQVITRSRSAPLGEDDPQSEPKQRGKVRIRNTVEICTQLNTVKVNGAELAVSSSSLGEGIERFDYCRGAI